TTLDVSELLASPRPLPSRRISTTVNSALAATPVAAGHDVVFAPSRRSVTRTTRSCVPGAAERQAYLIEYPVGPSVQTKPTVGAALIAVVSRSRGLCGGAAAPAPRPPRAARPARPAAGAAGALDGAGGGAASAVSSGARSASLDQRNNSMVIGATGVPGPITLALSFSAGPAPSCVEGPSANVRSALAINDIVTAAASTATNAVRLLSVIVVRAPGPA